MFVLNFIASQEVVGTPIDPPLAPASLALFVSSLPNSTAPGKPKMPVANQSEVVIFDCAGNRIHREVDVATLEKVPFCGD